MKRLKVELTMDGNEDYLFFLDKWEPMHKVWDMKFVSMSEDECIQRSRIWSKDARLRVRAVDIEQFDDAISKTSIITATQKGETDDRADTD